MESYPEHYPNQTTKYTFDGINRYLSEKMVYIDLSKDLIGKNGCYTDFARMISDQCPWHLDYQDENERVVFDGPLPIQVENCISKIAERNPLLADGGRKGVYRRFPSVAVREALVNAVIHFDSSYDVDIEITMSKNDLRIESPGGIYPCCESDSIQVRNQCIAVLFRRLRYANLTSRGLIAIRNSYVNSGKKPRFASTSDSFVVNLPSIGSGKSDMDQTRKMVHDYLKDNRGTSIERMAQDLMISAYRSKKILKDMDSDGTAFCMGLGKKSMVFLCDPAGLTYGELAIDRASRVTFIIA